MTGDIPGAPADFGDGYPRLVELAPASADGAPKVSAGATAPQLGGAAVPILTVAVGV